MPTAPTLVAAKTCISYSASDGFRRELTFGTMRKGDGQEAKAALLDAHRESGRLLSLFGFTDEAMQVAADAHAEVAKHLKEWAANPGEHA